MIRIAVSVLLPLPLAVEPDEFTAKVVGVVDGDTITVTNDSYETRIMLSGIDCPERGQAFGKEARQTTWNLTYGNQVKVRGHRRKGRVVGDVILPDGTNLNDELVKKGLAWRIRINAKGDTVELVDPDGVLRSRVSYVGDEIGPGEWVEVGE